MPVKEVTIQATKEFRYSTRRLLPGDLISMPPRHAAVFIAKRQAFKVREPGTPLPPVPPKLAAAAVTIAAQAELSIEPAADTLVEAQAISEPEPPPVEDMAALRQRYEEVIGRPPFNGWSADILRKRIEAALEK